MENKIKRLILGIIMGAILGIFCIIGVSQRLPDPVYPNALIYLIGAWYNRVVMGALIGLAGDIKLLKEKDSTLNATLRGAIIGAFVSVSFAFFSQEMTITYFFAGMVFGLLNDIITTNLTKQKD